MVMPVRVRAFVPTWKLRETSVAANHSPSPDCDAVMVHVPVLMTVTVDPLSVQTPVVVVEYETARPDDAVADNENGATPYSRSARDAKVIVWEPLAMVTVASDDVTDDTAPPVPVLFTITEYVAVSADVTLLRVRVEDVAPLMALPFLRH